MPGRSRRRADSRTVVLKNSDARYGLVTKSFHWLVFLLILKQFALATVMLTMPAGETIFGYTQGAIYEWHKSIGLLVLLVVLLRFIWRKATPLPEWAPNLSGSEKRAIHIIERGLYLCMLLMPVSGFLFVMTGGFGVKLFNVWDLPRLVPEQSVVARVAQLTHAATATGLVAMLIAHWTVTFRHEARHADGYVQRMLPFTNQT
jgi:cytochrome b561